MVHLIPIVVLAGWHNLSLLLRIGIDTPDLSAGLGKQDHPILTSSNALLLNTFARLKNPSWVNPAVASAYIRECNKNFPQNNPICAAILFREKDYFFDKKTKSHPPPDGWRLVVFY
jgi:hypothetical protein